MFEWANWWDGSPLEHLVSLYAGQISPRPLMKIPGRSRTEHTPQRKLHKRPSNVLEIEACSAFLQTATVYLLSSPACPRKRQPTSSSNNHDSLRLSHQDATNKRSQNLRLQNKTLQPRLSPLVPSSFNRQTPPNPTALKHLQDQGAVRQIKANAMLSGCRA
jgi:hypothetical protein